MRPWETMDLRGAIASGTLPARDMARAIAALSDDEEHQISGAIDSGSRYWSFGTGYWRCWRLGDAGTMAGGKGPDSVDFAWASLQEQGVLPAMWQSVRRVFVAETACLQCAHPFREWDTTCVMCRSDLHAVVSVSPRPRTVNDCAVMAADPDTIAHVEELARGITGDRDAVVAWRMLSPVALAHALLERDIETQWILVEHGYAIDPLVMWEGGIVLAAPHFGE